MTMIPAVSSASTKSLATHLLKQQLVSGRERRFQEVRCQALQPAVDGVGDL